MYAKSRFFRFLTLDYRSNLAFILFRQRHSQVFLPHTIKKSLQFEMRIKIIKKPNFKGKSILYFKSYNQYF
jgi:hypothetical protein